jgi:hypothetical protein
MREVREHASSAAARLVRQETSEQLDGRILR